MWMIDGYEKEIRLDVNSKDISFTISGRFKRHTITDFSIIKVRTIYKYATTKRTSVTSRNLILRNIKVRVICG